MTSLSSHPWVVPTQASGGFAAWFHAAAKWSISLRLWQNKYRCALFFFRISSRSKIVGDAHARLQEINSHELGLLIFWLVLWNMVYFSIYWGCHHPS